MHHSLQIMFILPPMTGHLFWKATILGGLYRGVPLYSGFGGHIPYLLMPWLLKSPGHQQEWYIVLTIQDRRQVGLLNCEFGLLLLNKTQNMIRNVKTSLWSLKQFSMLRFNHSFSFVLAQLSSLSAPLVVLSTSKLLAVLCLFLSAQQGV